MRLTYRFEQLQQISSCSIGDVLGVNGLGGGVGGHDLKLGDHMMEDGSGKALVGGRRMKREQMDTARSTFPFPSSALACFWL